MAGFRFPLSPPQSLGELFERLRELLPQLEAKVLPNRPVGTTETKIAHGMRSTPVFVVPSHPHCIAIVRETRRADKEHIYLRATNPCVVNVWCVSVGDLAKSLVPDGGYALPDWNPGGSGSDDHEVKATATDTGHGPLITKVKALSGISITETETGGVKQVGIACTVSPGVDDHLVKARNADATDVGGILEKTTDSPTVTRKLVTEGGVEKVQLNTVAQADPISFASTLYAAHLNDQAWFGNVKAVFGLAGCVNALFSTQWTELRPGVWKSVVNFDISGTIWVDNESVDVGDLVLAWLPVLVEVDLPRTGIYVIRARGGSFESPILERVDYANSAEDFAHGMVVYCTGGGAGSLFKGHYFRLTTTPPIVLETTPLLWEQLDSYTLVSSDNLLTSAQLAQASDTPNTTALVASLNSPSEWLKFPTLAGTPNLDTYKAGRSEVWALARQHTAGSAGSITWLECLVVRDPGGANITLETINTSPIANPEDAIIKAFVDDATDRDLAGDGIGLWIRARSDSTTPAAIAVTWSDAAHSTRLLTPMTLAVGGSDDHQALTSASRGFVAGQESAARRSRHPRRSVEDFASVPLSFSSGNLTPEPFADTTIISTEQTIDRIDSSQWPGGFCRSHKIFFINGGHLRQGQGDSGDFLAVDLGNFDGRDPLDVQQLDFNNNGVVDLMLIGGGWRLCSFYSGRKNS